MPKWPRLRDLIPYREEMYNPFQRKVVYLCYFVAEVVLVHLIFGIPLLIFAKYQEELAKPVEATGLLIVSWELRAGIVFAGYNTISEARKVLIQGHLENKARQNACPDQTLVFRCTNCRALFREVQPECPKCSGVEFTHHRLL